MKAKADSNVIVFTVESPESTALIYVAIASLVWKYVVSEAPIA
jgi:hypothetical protein